MQVPRAAESEGHERAASPDSFHQHKRGRSAQFEPATLRQLLHLAQARAEGCATASRLARGSSDHPTPTPGDARDPASILARGPPSRRAKNSSRPSSKKRAYEITTPLRLCVRSEIDFASRAIQATTRPDASAAEPRQTRPETGRLQTRPSSRGAE